MRTALIVLFGVLGAFVCIVIFGIAIIGRDRRPPLDRELYAALEVGDTNYLRQYLNRGGDVNRSILPRRRGMQIAAPLLYYAIRQSQPEVVDFLLKNRADPNKPDTIGDTPLIWASALAGDVMSDEPFPEQIDIFKRLLEAGADPNKAVEHGHTPLLQAAMKGQANSVTMLLRTGANVNSTNTSGMTALHFTHSARVARLLLEAGADPTLRTTNGETAADAHFWRSQFDRRSFGVLNVLTNSVVRINSRESKDPR